MDTDNGKTDEYGDSCSEYKDNPSWCTEYFNINEETGFDATKMCCTCGGGKSKQICSLSHQNCNK